MLPAGHTTKSLGNSTMTHNRPHKKNNRAHGGKKHPFENNIFVSVFNFVYLFLYPHTTTINKYSLILLLKGIFKESYMSASIVNPCTCLHWWGFITLWPPLKLLNGFNYSRNSTTKPKESPQIVLFGSGWMLFHLFRKRNCCIKSIPWNDIYLARIFPFFPIKDVCYWEMSSYWFQRTVLTAFQSIVECNSGIFQMKRKVLLFYVPSKLASSEANPLSSMALLALKVT